MVPPLVPDTKSSKDLENGEEKDGENRTEETLIKIVNSFFSSWSKRVTL